MFKCRIPINLSPIKLLTGISYEILGLKFLASSTLTFLVKLIHLRHFHPQNRVSASQVLIIIVETKEFVSQTTSGTVLNVNVALDMEENLAVSNRLFSIY